MKSTSKENFQLKDLKGKITILFFYPKDNTPGCTNEANDFAKMYSKLVKLDTQVFGASMDSLESHQKFKKKLNLPFDLISDEEQVLCKKFDVIKLKNMYGKKFLGIERSTFLLDDKSKIIREWRKVKVPGHANEVFEFVKKL